MIMLLGLVHVVLVYNLLLVLIVLALNHMR